MKLPAWWDAASKAVLLEGGGVGGVFHGGSLKCTSPFTLSCLLVDREFCFLREYCLTFCLGIYIWLLAFEV